MSDYRNAKRGDDRNPAQRLGMAIAERRALRGVSQRGMARALNLQQATMHKIELGERMPTREQALAIAKFLDYELTPLHIVFPDLYPAPPLHERSRPKPEAA